MTLPTFASLKNQQADQFRTKHATKLSDDYHYPYCLFRLEPQEGSSSVYSIQNQENQQYFQCHVTTMVNGVTSDCQRWEFVAVDGSDSHYYIRNVKNRKYLTKKAHELHHGDPGPDQVWIIEDRYTGGVDAWMGDDWDQLRGRSLQQMCLPASHDSGMYTINEETTFGDRRNCQTQILRFSEQLAQGIRRFDVRPVRWTHGNWYAAHYHKFAGHLQGAAGGTMKNILGDVRDFFEDTRHRQELVILGIGHLLDWHKDKPLSLEEFGDLAEMIQDHLKPYLVRSETALPLLKMPLGEILEHGNVIITVPNQYANPSAGLWSDSALPEHGGYSNTMKVEEMVDTQLKKIQSLCSVDRDYLVSTSWQLTLNWLASTPIGDLAHLSILELTGAALAELRPNFQRWIEGGVINELVYPNLLQTDGCFESGSHAVEISRQINALNPSPHR